MPLTPQLHKQLQGIVGESRALEAQTFDQYGKDRTTAWQANPCAVVLPASVLQVQQLVALANQQGLAIVPSGGRTGLSGGAVAANGELVVALDKMNHIVDINTTERTISCQAGVITHALQTTAAQHGLYYPVDFASAGSSQIGGNIATNAGGIKVMRYGMMRNWVRSLTVVTGSGQLLTLNNGLIKNNSGYDFRHLFIGSEGTLGIICEATLGLTLPPENPTVILLAVAEAAAIAPLLALFNGQLSLTAGEFFTHQALAKVLERQAMSAPLATPAPFYLLIEYEQLNHQTEERALQLFGQAVAKHWAVDGVISKSQAQAQQLWRLREDISETLAEFSPHKNDISVKPGQIAEFMAAADQLIATEYPEFEVIWFGHVGDGNLHLNILKPAAFTGTEFTAACSALSQRIAAKVQQFGGSVSAEHGVGLLKKDYLHFTRSAEEIALMRQIKQLFDPNGIMNPGKIFD